MNRKPATVQLTGAQRADAFALQEALQWLSDRDGDFARSLLGQLRSKGTLSAKQWSWVHTLAERAVMRAPLAIAEHIACHCINGNV